MELTQNYMTSLRKLWTIALPLMLSSLSGMIMVFVDRLTLSHYSLEAHNAAVEATNIGWAFLIGLSVLAGVTQIFVSQHYGAGNHRQIGAPVWQMIWLALCSTALFWTLSFWCPHLFFGSDSTCEMQRTYFSWMLMFTPAHGLFAALCGFFIGRGKTLLPTVLVLLGNIVNGLLCYTLVFGIEGIIPSLGIKGAAIATNTAVTGQVLIFFIAFFRPANRLTYGTDAWRLDLPLLGKCLRVGLPNAFFTILEISGWAFFYRMMAGLGQDHLTVAGIVQNILILSFFFNDGLSRAVSALVGNAIGAKNFSAVRQIVAAGFISMTFFGIGLAVFLGLAYDNVLNLFLHSMPLEQRTLLYSSLIFGCANAVIYKYLEGIRMVVAGALTAAADTLFLLFAGSLSVWVGMVLPVYFFVYLPGGSIERALGLCSVYTLLAATVYLCRFYSNAWQAKAALIQSTTEEVALETLQSPISGPSSAKAHTVTC